MEASVDPQCRGPDWMPITPKTGSLFHAETHKAADSACQAIRRAHICRMAETYIGGVQLVVATKAGFRAQLWAVAVPRAEAVSFVEKRLPGWTVTLSGKHLTPAQAAGLSLRPGQAQEVHQ